MAKIIYQYEFRGAIINKILNNILKYYNQKQKDICENKNQQNFENTCKNSS